MITLRHEDVCGVGGGIEISDSIMPAKGKISSGTGENEPSAQQESNAGAITSEQIKLLRQSFALVEPKAGLAGLVFYRNLFALDPTLRPLFKTSIELQSRKLMDALSYTVAALENPGALVPVLEAMGRRHVGYGARDEHYATVTAALLQSLGEVLGDKFTAEVQKAWAGALTLVADIMKRGAAAVLSLKMPGDLESSNDRPIRQDG
jgi:hemoglobin-like flavoprotein